ncbi:hypothetical protein [Nocardioides mangrovi]|uniref:ATP-binding protein n=1 Tax=Nocardioides mangrovi TaxID=2874580 RepID=A0ABS7UHY7_9ACTN|nr:hypothetical protein [Nocardioides mangrovi]MBZ5740648.1 hypothetical protein [Nocardioides mangrovi]
MRTPRNEPAARVPDGSDEGVPGVTRFDLVCHPDVVDTALELVGRWAEDRVLPEAGQERLLSLTRAAISHGLRFAPRGVIILVRWLDLERVRLDARWVGGSSSAQPGAADADVGATISTLDVLADEWGVGRAGDGWVLWMVAATA